MPLSQPHIDITRHEDSEIIEFQKARENAEIRRVGEGAALLSLIEVGLGSVLHAFRAPLTGQLLSLNQGFLLTRFSLTEKSNKSLPATVSLVSALLKSLSPAGKKLTPMLAIGAQGVLFNLGTLVFGMNPVGFAVGMILLCLWAYIQPALIYFLIYGRTLIDVARYFYEKLSEVYPFTSESLIFVLGFAVLTKIILGLALVALAYRLPTTAYERYVEYLHKLGWRGLEREPGANHQLTQKEKIRRVLRDLMQPLFLVSLAMTAVFFIFSESNWSQVIWALLRPLGVAFILFYAVRYLPLDRIVALKGGNSIVRATRYAADVLRKIKK